MKIKIEIVNGNYLQFEAYNAITRRILNKYYY